MRVQFSSLPVGVRFRLAQFCNNDGRLDMVFTKCAARSYRAPCGAIYEMREIGAEVIVAEE